MANRNFKDDSGSEYAHQQSAANDGLFATPALDDNYDNTNNSNTTDIDSNHHPPSYSQITLNRSARWALDTIRTMYNYLTSPSLPSINLNHVDTAQAPSANQWLSFSPQNLANFQIIPALPLHNNDTSNNYMVYQSSAPIEHNQTVYTDPHRPKTAHLSVNPRVQTLEIAIYHHHQPPIFRQQTIIATEGQSNATAPSQTRLSYYQQPSNETLFSNISDTTLTEEEQQNRRPSAGGECYSISEILGEQRLRAAAIATAPPNKSDSSIINRFAKEADRRPVPSLIKGDRKSSKWSRILRIVNCKLSNVINHHLNLRKQYFALWHCVHTAFTMCFPRGIYRFSMRWEQDLILSGLLCFYV
jgi:hypothetical protein